MTNLEIVLIYFAIGLMFTLVISEIRRCLLEPEEVLFGVTCWVVIMIAMFGSEVYQRIKKWKRKDDNDNRKIPL